MRATILAMGMFCVVGAAQSDEPARADEVEFFIVKSAASCESLVDLRAILDGNEPGVGCRTLSAGSAVYWSGVAMPGKYGIDLAMVRMGDGRATHTFASALISPGYRKAAILGLELGVTIAEARQTPVPAMPGSRLLCGGVAGADPTNQVENESGAGVASCFYHVPAEDPGWATSRPARAKLATAEGHVSAKFVFDDVGTRRLYRIQFDGDADDVAELRRVLNVRHGAEFPADVSSGVGPLGAKRLAFWSTGLSHLSMYIYPEHPGRVTILHEDSRLSTLAVLRMARAIRR